MNIQYTSAQVREIRDDVEETREIDFIISTSGKDRHGTSLNMDNWNLNNYSANPIVGYQHNLYGGGMCSQPDPNYALGYAVNTKTEVIDNVRGDGETEKMLVSTIRFEPAEINPLAEQIFQKVRFGTLRTASVGFKPILDDDGKEGRRGRRNEDGDMVDTDTFFYYGQELLEWSIVNIPSNPEATQKSLRAQTAHAMGFLKKEFDLPFGEIETMTIKDVLDNIGKGTRYWNPADTRNVDQPEGEEGDENGDEGPNEDTEASLSLKKRALEISQMSNPE